MLSFSLKWEDDRDGDSVVGKLEVHLSGSPWMTLTAYMAGGHVFVDVHDIVALLTYLNTMFPPLEQHYWETRFLEETKKLGLLNDLRAALYGQRNIRDVDNRS